MSGTDVRRLRILVVDDDERLLASIGRMLARDYEVTMLSDPERALGLIEGDGFDVILSDLMMPGMTGMELHDAVRARQPDLVRRMLFMTGGAFTAAARDFIASPTIDYVEKPFNIRELRARVASLIERNARGEGVSPCTLEDRSSRDLEN